jgi:hypothetical protein
MATAGGFFSQFFGNNNGGIEHNGGGRATPLPSANPQQQLTNGTSAPAGAGGTPEPQVTKPDPLNSHLEDLSKVWQTATTSDGKPIQPQADPLAMPLFSLKPEDVTAAASKLDFTSNINPELAAKALGGDAAALMEMINTATRTAFVASTLNGASMMNDGFGRHGKAIDAALPTRLKNHALASATSEDPVLSHKAAQPILKGMMLTIAQNNPHLSAAQVQEAAETYVKGLGEAFSMGKQQETVVKAAAEETDWLNWGGLDNGAKS